MFGAAIEVKFFDVVRNELQECIKATPEIQRSYFMTPIDLRDAEQLDLWVRQRHMQSVELSMKDVSAEFKTQIMLAEATNISSMAWTSSKGWKLLACVDGMTMLALAAFHKRHPTLTREQLRELLCCVENWQAMNKALKESANAMGIGVPHPISPLSMKPKTELRQGKTLKTTKRKSQKTKG